MLFFTVTILANSNEYSIPFGIFHFESLDFFL